MAEAAQARPRAVALPGAIPVQIAPWRAGEFLSCLVTHELRGSAVRTVTINRLATCTERLITGGT